MDIFEVFVLLVLMKPGYMFLSPELPAMAISDLVIQEREMDLINSDGILWLKEMIVPNLILENIWNM